jgi:hypothetical protein
MLKFFQHRLIKVGMMQSRFAWMENVLGDLKRGIGTPAADICRRFAWQFLYLGRGWGVVLICYLHSSAKNRCRDKSYNTKPSAA